jgi:hypothetical protein
MLRFNQFLFEKRTEQNQTESAIDILLSYADDPDIYISFTNIDKIGINPSSKFNTPNGIYSYPLKQFKKALNQHTKMSSVFPFASDRPYIWIFKKNCSNFVDDVKTEYTSKDYDSDMEKLRKFYSKDFNRVLESDIVINNTKRRLNQYKMALKQQQFSGKNVLDLAEPQINDLIKKTEKELKVYTKSARLIDDNKENRIAQLKEKIESAKRRVAWLDTQPLKKDDEDFLALSKIYINDLIELEKSLKLVTNMYTFDDLVSDASKESRDSTPISKFWNVTRWIANGGVDAPPDTSMTFKWNNILRKLGYCGFADKSGSSTIHPNEPIQAVFLSKNAIKPIKRIENITDIYRIEDEIELMNGVKKGIVNIIIGQGKVGVQ